MGGGDRRFGIWGDLMAERIYFRCVDGGLKPADNWAASNFEKKGYKQGDIVSVDVRKVRNRRFNAFVHVFGDACIKNIPSFAEIEDAHKAIKRLQLESGIECDEMAINLDGFGMVVVKQARSFAFDRMGEEDFKAAAQGISDYAVAKYGGALTQDQLNGLVSASVNR